MQTIAAKTTTRKPARAKATPTVSAPRSTSTAPAAVLLLRTCGPNGEAYGDFRWPLEVGAEVVAPDWSPEPKCGRGLHGLLWGQGDPTSAWHWEPEAKWLVIEAAAEDVVDLGGKSKVPRCRIVHVGDQRTSTEYLAARAPAGVAIVGGTATAGEGGTATAGEGGTATAGYLGTATAGDRGTATAGYRGTATAGEDGTATAGDGGTATAGEGGTATAGYRGTATAGYRGTATAGDRGTATAGDLGTATAGEGGTATAGDGGTATAGEGGTATAGDGGTVCILYWDDERQKWRRAIGEVGEDGIELNVAYVVRDGKLIRKEVRS